MFEDINNYISQEEEKSNEIRYELKQYQDKINALQNDIVQKDLELVESRDKILCVNNELDNSKNLLEK